MTYRAGTRGLSMLGIPDDEPRVICDGDGCRRVLRVNTSHIPPRWLLDGKAPPRWRLARDENGNRRDFCPRCKGGR